MKKLVPDPPPVLCIREGLSLDEALHLARQHLDRAIETAGEAARDAPIKHEIVRALLKVCASNRAVVV